MTDYIVNIDEENKETQLVLAEKLIRCKDCDNYRPHEISKGLPYCEWSGALTSDDDFCSHAERKEE